MTWSIFNALSFGAKPVWLYEIDVGGQKSYFTSGPRPVITPIGVPDATFVAQTTWNALGITRGTLTESDVASKRVVSVSLPRSAPIADTVINLDGIVPLSVTIWQGFAGDPDNEYVSFFRGRALQVRPRFTEVTLECLDVRQLQKTPALSRVITRSCPYAVFSGECGASKAAFRVNGTATAIDNLTVTVTEAAGQANGYFRLGTLEWNGLSQVIDSHSGSTLVLAGTIPGFAEAVGAGSVAVGMLPGCRKTLSYCGDIFSNTINHGGLPKISSTPYDGRSLV